MLVSASQHNMHNVLVINSDVITSSQDFHPSLSLEIMSAVTLISVFLLCTCKLLHVYSIAGDSKFGERALSRGIGKFHIW